MSFKSYTRLCRFSSRLFGGLVRLSEDEHYEIQKALLFLGIKLTPKESKSLAIAATVFTAIAIAATILLLSILFIFSIFWSVLFTIPVLLYFYLKKYPQLKRDIEMKNALSQLPEFMSYTIMSLRVNPNLERALQFAVDHSKGRFRIILRRILYDVHTGRCNTEKALSDLADEWGQLCGEFKRSMRLVIASTAESSETRRQITLDKASEVLSEGLSKRASNAARALHTPVMVVFTFGIILPLIFIAIIPFISLMGITIGVPTIALIYTIGIPVFLYIIIKFIASNRPLTMAPARIPKEEYSGHIVVLLAIVVGSFSIILGIVSLLGFDLGLGSLSYLPFAWGVAAGVSIYLLLTARRVRVLRKCSKDMEKEFGEMLHQLGVILTEGHSLENSISRIEYSDTKSKSLGFFQVAANNIRLFNTDIRSAFFDPKFGALKKVYSDMITGTMDIITSVADKGSEAVASVNFRIASQINNMQKVDDEIEKTLGSIVSSMKIIAMVVGPLVGGMISSMSVVLADTMADTSVGGEFMGFSTAAPAPLDPQIVTFIIAVYVVESAIIMMAFATELIHGNDSVMKRYNIGIAAPVAIFVFTICAWLSSSIFSGMA